MSYQKVVIVGNLGANPTLSPLPSGQQVANFNVATNRSYKNAEGQRVKETTWFKVAVYGASAKPCADYLRTGSQVLVEGRMSIDKNTGGPKVWFNGEGQPRASLEITGERVVFLSSAGTNGNPGDLQPNTEIVEDGEPVITEEEMDF